MERFDPKVPSFWLKATARRRPYPLEPAKVMMAPLGLKEIIPAAPVPRALVLVSDPSLPIA